MRYYFRAILLVGLVAYAAWASISPAVQAELNWRELRARGTLRIGIDPGIQPFSFYDESGWSGFDADLARELATRLNLNLSSDSVGYDSMYDALQTQRIDLALSAVSPDPNRTADVAYSLAYFDAGIRAVSLSAINTPADLGGKRVAVGLGTEADRLVRFWERRVPHLQRLPLPNDAAALAALRSGQADVALVSVFSMGHLMGLQPGKCAAWPRAPMSSPCAAATHACWPRLTGQLNRCSRMAR